MAKTRKSRPGENVSYGSDEGNEARDGMGSTDGTLSPMALHGVRLSNLEGAVSTIDKFVKVNENDIKFVKSELALGQRVQTGQIAGNIADGNEAKIQDVAAYTLEVRLANLEKALNSLDSLFTGLQGSVIHLEKWVRDIGIKQANMEKRIEELEKRIEASFALMTRDIQAIKVALVAFSNHIHLPDGKLGMPFTLKG